MMMVYMLGNNIKARLLATGTFEVTVNGKLVWSALEKKRTPSWPEILFALQEAGLERVDGADDESMFPSGWAAKKNVDASIDSGDVDSL